MKTGVIGLGAMGMPMARNLHRTGYLAAVWNRSMEKSRQLADEIDVPVAVEPAALAQNCDLIIISVSADADVLEVVEAMLPGVRPGTVVVDTSTGQESALASGIGRYQGLVASETGYRVAFRSDYEDWAAEEPAFSLYVATHGDDPLARVAGPGSDGVPEGWGVSEHGSLTFSDSKSAIFGLIT